MATHLHDALGLTREELLRRCDRLTGAKVLFWTLGAKQVGKGALIGGQQVLQPGLGWIRLWPFDGPLLEVLAPGVPVVAETYLAAFYHQLNIRPVKRQPSSRAAASTALLDWARDNHVDVDTLRPDMVRGFETDDDFDAVIGLLGMINVVRRRQAEGRPASDEMLAIEGWMLGLAQVVS